MKKLILILGAFLIICVIISHIAQEKTYSIVHNNEPQDGVSESVGEEYTIKSENGRIVVYRGEELLYKTQTATANLPKIDQNKLLYGIVVKSEEEVRRILENLCS